MIRRPSRPAVHALRVVMSSDETESAIGDLNEDLVRINPRVPRLWLEWKAWTYVLSALPAALDRLRRSVGYVFRDAVRALRTARNTTAFTLLILTLAISAATVTFSVVDTVVIRPLPFSDGNQLMVVELENTRALTQARALGPHGFQLLRDHARAFSSLAALQRVRLSIQDAGETTSLVSFRTTANVFDVLRVRPAIGQVFTAEHEAQGNDNVGVLSHDFWQRRFGADPGIVGRSIRVTDRALMGGTLTELSVLVLGVMPEGFAYPLADNLSPEIWMPYVMTPDERAGVERGFYLHVVGRLREEASLNDARREVESVRATLAQTTPRFYANQEFTVTPLKDTLVGGVRGWMLLMLSAVVVVLLVACANVANLQLARATYRARDLAIRSSLGATRRQLATSLLIESLMLSLIAAGFAIVFSIWGIGVAKAALPATISRTAEIGLDLRVLTAAIGAALVTALVFGAVPAWQASRADVMTLLKPGAQTTKAGRRLRASFVIAEIALVTVLLVTATLIIASFIQVTRADLGFERSNVLVITAPGQRGTAAEVIEQLQAVPEVASVGTIAFSSPPLVSAGFAGGGATGISIAREGAPAGTDTLNVELRQVSSGYFAAAGIPLIRGQFFDDSEGASQNAIVIDETTARTVLGHQEPIGAVLNGPAKAIGRRIVVGVVRDVRLRGPEQIASPEVYVPSLSTDRPTEFLVRTSDSPLGVIPRLQAALAARMAEGSRPAQIRALEDAFRNITAARRFNASIMAFFAGLVVIIGAAGVYGVMTSVVAQQTRELGVRAALGATRRRIVGGVVGQASRYLGLGLVIGVGTAWWVSKTFASLLFEVRPTDIGIYAVVVIVLLVTGLLAAVVPARRAAHVDPLVALRSD